MKRRITFLVGLILLVISTNLYAPWVSGYFRKDGTYVSGYWRSSPNEYKYDNKNFNNWDSPYQTDWYNKSYYTKRYGKEYGSRYYENLEETEDYLKQIERKNKKQSTISDYQPYQSQSYWTLPEYDYDYNDYNYDSDGYDYDDFWDDIFDE